MHVEKLNKSWKEMLEDTSCLGRSVEYDFTKPFFLSDENILDVHWYFVPVNNLPCPICQSYFISRKTPFNRFEVPHGIHDMSETPEEDRCWVPIVAACADLLFHVCPPHHGYRYLLGCPNCVKCTIDDARRIAYRVERGVNFTYHPVAEVEAHYPEWVKCPSCRLNFKYTSEGSFRDGRHNNCGQRLCIIEYPGDEGQKHAK